MRSNKGESFVAEVTEQTANMAASAAPSCWESSASNSIAH